MESRRLKAILYHAGSEEIRYLGEGAWHHAWKVRKGSSELVLRIPKEVAYGKTVPYNVTAFKAEYGGTELYYRCVNKAVKGAAPPSFDFHIGPGQTYTLETFGGKRIDLHALSDEASFFIGEELGKIHRKTEAISHGLEGFGYLAWSEDKGLHGSFSSDPAEFLKKESEGYLADYETLCKTRPEFRDDGVLSALQAAACLRKKSFKEPVLVNQDASPENIVMDGHRVCVIDPFPSI